MPQVELLKPHTHASVDHVPGEVITLDEDLARWLANLGTARPVREAPAPTNQPTAEKSK